MRGLMLIGCLIGAAIAGASLYAIAFEVERMEAELAALERDIRRERESIHTMEAEWAYLARPDRIAELSDRYLPGMRRVSADRITRVDDLPFEPLGDALDVLPPEDLATPASMPIPQRRPSR